jgi:hypothetical protein
MRAAWQKALEGFSMIESPIIADLLAEAKIEEKVATQVETLLRLILRRYKELPEEVSATVRACTDRDQLNRWLDSVVEAESLAQFRQQTGL